ncbi:MAG TPA: MFS transporter [Gemmatimonadota bacterium]|nr:MFS transporter [Gemmatimonadota bacterium]
MQESTPNRGIARGPGRPSLLDRALRPFTDVRAGEAPTALLLALNVFLLLMAYYFIKPLREALILGESGAEVKSYASAVQAILLLGAVPLYGRLAERLPRRTLINRVTVFFAACLVLFFVLGTAGVPLGIPFYLWVGIFNLMIVAQFWAFANDVYTNHEGERLFPLVQFGASVGAVLGSVVVGRLIEPLGIYPPMLLAAAILMLSLALTTIVDRRERRRTEAHRAPGFTTLTHPAATGEFRLETGEYTNLREGLKEALARAERGEEDPAGEGEGRSSEAEAASDAEPNTAWAGRGAFQLVFRTRYLLLIAILVLLVNWVNTTGEYILGRLVEETAISLVAGGETSLSEGQYIGRFYSDFFSVVNAVSLLVQLFLVSRIVKYLGVRVAIMILPAIALGGYALLAFFPLLSVVRWAKTAENSTDYSLQNTVRNILFLPLTREQKYKAKQVTDAFFWRAGDVLSAAVVFVGTTWLSMQTSHFALLNLALVAAWLVIAWRIGTRYRHLVRTGGPPLTS